MKKHLLVTCICLVTITTTGCARQTSKSLVVDKMKSASAIYLNDISIRAVRDFSTRYSEATAVEWYKIGDDYVAKFLLNDNKHRTIYKANGEWLYTVQTYKEAKMPKDIRHIVKREYYDYTITQVDEVTHLGRPVVYIVHMMDSTTWRNVRVCEGEMDVLEVFNKG